MALAGGREPFGKKIGPYQLPSSLLIVVVGLFKLWVQQTYGGLTSEPTNCVPISILGERGTYTLRSKPLLMNSFPHLLIAKSSPLLKFVSETLAAGGGSDDLGS